jgi:hypothetical protein
MKVVYKELIHKYYKITIVLAYIFLYLDYNNLIDIERDGGKDDLDFQRF